MPRVAPDDADIFLTFLMPYEPPFYNWTARERMTLRTMEQEDMTSMSNTEWLSVRKSCAELRGAEGEELRRSSERSPSALEHAISTRTGQQVAAAPAPYT